jgi:hypothetical protein
MAAITKATKLDPLNSLRAVYDRLPEDCPILLEGVRYEDINYCRAQQAGFRVRLIKRGLLIMCTRLPKTQQLALFTRMEGAL